VLYADILSRPNVPVNVLVGLDALKAGFGWSDQDKQGALESCKKFKADLLKAVTYLRKTKGTFLTYNSYPHGELSRFKNIFHPLFWRL